MDSLATPGTNRTARLKMQSAVLIAVDFAGLDKGGWQREEEYPPLGIEGGHIKKNNLVIYHLACQQRRDIQE